MNCPCNKDNLLYCGTLPDGRYRYQCMTCHGAWAFAKQSFVPGEALAWVQPFGAPPAPVEEDRPAPSPMLDPVRLPRRLVKRKAA